MRILGTEIKAGNSYTLNLNKVKLYSTSEVEVPVIIERGELDGPVVLLTGGIHGDEINGIEVVRQIIAHGWNKPKRGTIICIPVVNIFGFLQLKREFPDGRDLNRVFPGTKKGSLASRFAYQLSNEVLPIVDIVMDFHTGGAQRYNAPHLRVDAAESKSIELAKVFNAPCLYFSSNISKTFRATCSKKGIPYLLYEGGKSGDSDKTIAVEAVKGVLRVLEHLDMVTEGLPDISVNHTTVEITKSSWLRAKKSGFIHPKAQAGNKVKKDEIIASITDPYGKLRHEIKAPHDTFLLNVNYGPVVYQGDAIFHISKDE
ncbi:succinylglutamate desuccinylase/aspartoacylase family protein [Nonlabens sp. SCSIO 43208]|uniref:succinylglutamate desuccinylase/aspartoacylase family protein n=1 Tax=Nonlabens sp. SCSIO 43208 TaxID=2793009 RepID=UPI003D6A7437